MALPLLDLKHIFVYFFMTAEVDNLGTHLISIQMWGYFALSFIVAEVGNL
jgi:hypothetical protein